MKGSKPRDASEMDDGQAPHEATPTNSAADAVSIHAQFEERTSPEREPGSGSLLDDPACRTFFETQADEYQSLTPEQISNSDLASYVSERRPRGMRLSETPVMDSVKTTKLLIWLAEERLMQQEGSEYDVIHALEAARAEKELLTYFEKLLADGNFEIAEHAYMAAMRDFVPTKRFVAFAEKCFDERKPRRGLRALQWMDEVVPSHVLIAWGHRAEHLGLMEDARKFFEKAEDLEKHA